MEHPFRDVFFVFAFVFMMVALTEERKYPIPVTVSSPAMFVIKHKDITQINDRYHVQMEAMNTTDVKCRFYSDAFINLEDAEKESDKYLYNKSFVGHYFDLFDYDVEDEHEYELCSLKPMIEYFKYPLRELSPLVILSFACITCAMFCAFDQGKPILEMIWWVIRMCGLIFDFYILRPLGLT